MADADADAAALVRHSDRAASLGVRVAVVDSPLAVASSRAVRLEQVAQPGRRVVGDRAVVPRGRGAPESTRAPRSSIAY